MKVQIISYEDPNTWILGKFARKMSEYLGELEVEVTLARKPDPDADVNHHICYVNYEGFSDGINTLMVTHVDSVGKLRLLKHQLDTADLAVCMSAHTMQNLQGAGLPGNKICYVNPAHDGVLSPRRLRIGIMTRLYDDGRKNEAAFEAMLDRLPGQGSPLHHHGGRLEFRRRSNVRSRPLLSSCIPPSISNDTGS